MTLLKARGKSRRPWHEQCQGRRWMSLPFIPSTQKTWNFSSPPDTLSGMYKIVEIFADRAALHTEILDLRQQVAVLKRKRPGPSLRMADRVFWVILSCLWPGWRHTLVIVRPETVIGWHRKGFRLFWTWKSRRGKPGRPPVSREIRDLIRRMSRENTRWGAPRIHGELLKLGFFHLPGRRLEIPGPSPLATIAVVAEAMANKTARIAWAVLARQETYRAPVVATN